MRIILITLALLVSLSITNANAKGAMIGTYNNGDYQTITGVYKDGRIGASFSYSFDEQINTDDTYTGTNRSKTLLIDNAKVSDSVTTGLRYYQPVISGSSIFVELDFIQSTTCDVYIDTGANLICSETEYDPLNISGGIGYFIENENGLIMDVNYNLLMGFGFAMGMKF